MFCIQNIREKHYSNSQLPHILTNISKQHIFNYLSRDKLFKQTLSFFMGRYGLSVLKVPLNSNQPTNQPTIQDNVSTNTDNCTNCFISQLSVCTRFGNTDVKQCQNIRIKQIRISVFPKNIQKSGYAKLKRICKRYF